MANTNSDAVCLFERVKRQRGNRRKNNWKESYINMFSVCFRCVISMGPRLCEQGKRTFINSYLLCQYLLSIWKKTIFFILNRVSDICRNTKKYRLYLHWFVMKKWQCERFHEDCSVLVVNIDTTKYENYVFNSFSNANIHKKRIRTKLLIFRR